MSNCCRHPSNAKQVKIKTQASNKLHWLAAVNLPGLNDSLTVQHLGTHDQLDHGHLGCNYFITTWYLVLELGLCALVQLVTSLIVMI